jgi:hypothetical protein
MIHAFLIFTVITLLITLVELRQLAEEIIDYRRVINNKLHPLSKTVKILRYPNAPGGEYIEFNGAELTAKVYIKDSLYILDLVNDYGITVCSWAYKTLTEAKIAQDCAVRSFNHDSIPRTFIL